jgi:hypothetical protein
MGGQLPTVPDEWMPLASSQYLAAVASTALTIPTAVAGQPLKGAIQVAILTAINGPMWIRYDGAPAFAITGADPMYEGDWVVVYGYASLSAIRVVKDAAGTGLMSVKYWYFRKTPS